MGVFPDPVHPEFGATQGYQSRHFLRDGFKLETLWAPPAVLAVRMPGSGDAFKRRLAQIPRAAIWDAIASCSRSVGRVRARRSGLDPGLSWTLHRDDVPILAKALWTLAEIFFAAGARSIVPGVHGIPDELHSRSEAEILRTHPLKASDIVSGGNHAFCTTRMHGDPTRGVVDEDGKCHDYENLWIADTGIFPRCPSVNPMWTGMALAHRTAGILAERL
jgi:choline dehydrogenase-like flavoprotein